MTQETEVFMYVLLTQQESSGKSGEIPNDVSEYVQTSEEELSVRHAMENNCMLWFYFSGLPRSPGKFDTSRFTL